MRPLCTEVTDRVENRAMGRIISLFSKHLPVLDVIIKHTKQPVWHLVHSGVLIKVRDQVREQVR